MDRIRSVSWVLITSSTRLQVPALAPRQPPLSPRRRFAMPTVLISSPTRAPARPSRSWTLMTMPTQPTTSPFSASSSTWQPAPPESGSSPQLYPGGRTPAANANWAVEISLDIEWAHAIAPQAKILLVEAASNNLSDLLSGVDFAVRNGASVVSMSWTSAELSSERKLDNHFVSTGVTFLAASGDSGAGVNYPAA